MWDVHISHIANLNLARIVKQVALPLYTLVFDDFGIGQTPTLLLYMESIFCLSNSQLQNFRHHEQFLFSPQELTMAFLDWDHYHSAP